MKGYIRKPTAVAIIAVLAAAAVALGIVALTQSRRAGEYERTAAANYQHAFGELVTSVSELDTALQKGLYATSPSMVSAVCTEIFGKAMTAQMSLGVLPFSSQELEQTSGFISRVGDYAYALSRNAARGESYTDEELQNLRTLSDTASTLAANMKSLQTDLQDGVLTMDELGGAQNKLEGVDAAAGQNTVGSSMRLIEKEFPETPSLIYDGPFSEHITNARPKLLEGLDAVDEAKAKKAAAAFTGLGEDKLRAAGECAGRIPTWCFTASENGGDLNIAVTKQGGKVISLLSSRAPADSGLSPEDAAKIAARFLEAQGYSGMKETYRITQGGVVTVNYAWEQDGVLCYSDLVKVSVARDTGSVCAFGAEGYFSAHCERDLTPPAVGEEAARSAVPASLKILSSRLALVPTDGKYEVLCWEFKCDSEDGRHYIIYVNAATGEEQKILILLEDETGALTI